MRVGYAGRGVVHLVVAGFSLYAILRGGEAQGTSSALAQLESSVWGVAVLVAILVGMIAFAVWRVVNAAYDLEDRGAEGKGLLARGAMLVKAAVHLSIASVAGTLLISTGGGDGGSSLTRWLSEIMAWPAGPWMIGAAGLAVIAAGAVVGYKGWQGKYREHLQANPVTLHWNWFLKFGVIAKGVVVAIIGFLFVYAAWSYDPSAAGGTGEAFAWLTGQPFGRVLVGVVCLGLVAFAAYCFVNAAYRTVPKAGGEGVETLAARLNAALKSTPVSA